MKMITSHALCHIAVLILLMPAVLAWGPISHYYFACNAVENIQQLKPDFENLFIGADEPDRYMISQALWNETYGGDQELLSFAVGYATHNIADAVGFFASGGYLGNESKFIDWSLEWPFMLAIDSYINDNLFQSCNGMVPNFPTTPLSSSGVQFMADVNALVNAIDPNFPLLNATQIAACSNPWAPEVNRKNQYAEALLPATTAQQLVFFDHFGAVTEEQAVANMQTSIWCINAAHKFYFNLMFQPKADPLGVFQQTAAYINQLFAAGNCSVSPTKHSSARNPRLATE